MKKLKKLLPFLLAGTTVLSLAACNGKEAETETELPAQADTIDDNYRVYYEIFPSSFSDSDGDGYGDLKGIINRFDYLNDGNVNSTKSLGIQGIWLTPIFYSPTYHKYNATSYYKIDGTLGNDEDFDNLIKLAHSRNVQIIMDLAVNHTSNRSEWFEQFAEAQRNQDTENKYYNWYTNYTTVPAGVDHAGIVQGTNVYYEANFGTDFPELNFDNPEVRTEMVNVAKYWLDRGVDGFRFDAAKYVYYKNDAKNIEFWDWYMGELKKIKSDIYAVAEVWEGDSTVIPYNKVVNCFNFTSSQSEGYIADAAKGHDVNKYTKYFAKYQQEILAQNKNAMACTFIANHDTDRAAGFCNISSGAAFMAANLLLLNQGSPFMYYGEEIGIKGSRGGTSTDANRRLAMLWGDGDTVKNPEGSTFTMKSQTNGTVVDHEADKNSLLNYYRKVINVRNRHPEIARGTYTALDFKDTKMGGFNVVYNDTTIGIIHNTTTEEVTYDLSTLTGVSYTKIIETIGLGKATLKGNTLTVGAQTSIILQ